MNFTKLDVSIIRRVFNNYDTGYAVYTVEVLNTSKPDEMNDFPSSYVTVTGNFNETYVPGEEFYMYGEMTETKYGPQYRVSLVENKFDTISQVKDFLSLMTSPSIATQLVDEYGESVLDKIVDQDIDLSKIYGMAEYRFNALRDKVLENRYMKDVLIELSPYGVTSKQMKDIIEAFGANSVQRIKDNPYELCKIKGIGFLKADDIALKMGIDERKPERIQECIKYIIQQDQSNGNSWMSKNRILSECVKLLKLNKKIVLKQINENDDVVNIDDRIALKKIYNIEDNIAKKLLDFNNREYKLEFNVEDFINDQNIKNGFVMTKEQESFFYSLQNKNLVFLIGNAGTGKSFLQRSVVDLAEKLKLSILLLAPTGKSAKVLKEYCKREAYTIHRALHIFDNVEDASSVTEDIVLIDETSMTDIFVANKVLNAIANPNTKIIFCGDSFQLPSVSVGRFMHDCIESGKFSVTQLTKVWRQAEGGILDVATRVRFGEKFIGKSFDGKKKFGKDLLFCSIKSNLILDACEYYYKAALSKYDPEDIVILTPTKRGDLGTYAINKMIQNIVNPHSGNKKELNAKNVYGVEVIYRVGDNVMNIKNSYRIPTIDGNHVNIINGDSGIIKDIIENQSIIIDYGFAVVSLSLKQLNTIVQSYALTTHRSQGSACKCVIVIADKSHKYQLNANLVYTAITRASESEFILTQSETMNYAISQNANMKRNTFLNDILTGKIEKIVDKT